MKKLFAFLALIFSVGCLGMPDDIKPVANFELDKYLGKWYEIARLNHSFEEGLTKVTAEYSMREDGGVKVKNRGFSVDDNEWSESIGRAYFVETKDQGYLKVSFFGPFFGSYVIFELDDDYQHAFVTSSNTSYLWLLSRTPTVEQELIDDFVTKAKRLGYKTDELIFVEQQ